MIRHDKIVIVEKLAAQANGLAATLRFEARQVDPLSIFAR